MTLPYGLSSVRNHSLLLKTSHLCVPRSALGCFSPKDSPLFKKNSALFLSPQKHTSLPLKLVHPLASFSSYAEGDGDQQIQNSHDSDEKGNAEAVGDFSGMANAFHISSKTARAITIVIAFSALSLPLFMKSLGQGLALKTKLLSYATLLFGFYMAWNIGANDVANAMGTSVGSGALTIRQAVITAAVLEFSGALLMGTHVTSTMQKGILMANVFQGKDMLLFAGLLSSLAAAGTWLQVASYFGWPVSTTHCIVGSMVGFGLVYGGAGAVFWSSLAKVASSWVISPLMGALVSFLVYKCIRRMIFQLHAVYGEWLLRDFRWDFVVDDLKGGRLFLLNEDSTHAELVAMAQEDYNLDMRTVSVEISYSLPAEMMMAPGSLPIHVTSDRQVRNLLEILKTHRVCLCVSSRSKVETVSEKRDIDEAGEWEKDVGDNDEAGEWEEDVGDNDEAGEWEEDGEEENGEEDADNSIVGETDQNGGDYSLYGKVPDEDEEDDDNICFEEIQKTYAKTNAIEGGKSNGTSIYVNQSFVSKGALLSELRLAAVRGKFSFKLYKSTKTLVVATCPVSYCGWKVRASVKHGTNTFWVTKYVEKHLCSAGDRIAQRRHCTPKYVGSLFIDRVGIIDGITPQHITDAMRNMFGMALDYTTSYRALLYAQRLVRGSAEEGYSRLASYLEQISIANPDSITAIELDSMKRFKYLFLSFGASIKGFKYQRRVIVVDGTHLSGKYGGTMLVAAAQDGNFQIFPLAFGIVDEEDIPSLEWFFTKLASCISHDKPLVIVSDRHKAIKSACDKVFPWATRGICYYHLQDNIVKKFKGKHLMYLVKGAAYAHTVYDFDRYMAEIRSANPELATYLEKADVRLWSRVYCKGNRFNIKTSNIAESINSALKRARGFPITFLLEFIRQKLGKWYWKRRQDALSLTTEHSGGVEHLLAVREEIAGTMTVEPIDGWHFFVKGGKMDCVVDLEHAKCDCGVYGVEKIPCSHAIAAGIHAGLHISTLVCPLYSKNYLYAGYSENIYPIVSQHIEERECFPPELKRGRGRPKKSRWQSWLELSRMRGHKPRKKHRARRCSNCKETGHTKPQCTQNF